MKSRVAILLAAAALASPGQTSHWRAFKKTDGLPENACLSVTVGSGGDVFVRHPDQSSVTVLDGYHVTRIPAPDGNGNRVYESPGGQLWSVSPKGLQEFRNGQWVLHGVPEVTKHFPAGHADAVHLYPVRQGHVLVLLPDCLLSFDAVESASRVQMIRRAAGTHLESFTALSSAYDGGLWISGKRGVAKINGSLRDLKPEDEWTELIPPAELQIQNFGAVREDENGNLTVLAESAESRLPLLVRYDAQHWIVRSLGSAKPLLAWRDSGHTRVAASNSLVVFPDKQTASTRAETIPARQIFDAAADADGAFWLATPDGLFRHSPAIWETPSKPFVSVQENNPKISDILKNLRQNPGGKAPHSAPGEIPAAAIVRGDWKSFLAAQNGDLWLGGANEIAWRHEGSWRIFSSTNQIGPEGVAGFAEAPDGRIWCVTSDKVWKFDGEDWLEIRSGLEHINVVHSARDGTLWVGTNKGLWRFWRNAWIANGPEDGLPSEVIIKIAEDQRRRIWANTPAGWSVFNPDADTDPPETFLRTGANQKLREGTPVTFSFSGRDKWNRTAASRLLFSWRLDDREWSPFQEPAELGFNNLPVGKHLFQVRAMDRNGNIDPKPARLGFAVVLPWYREPRLVLILALALAVAIFFAGLAFNRHRKLLLSYAEVEKKIAERTRELERANRELLHSQKMNALGTIAAGIAHDFNNILSIIKGSAQIIEENAGNPQKIRIRLDRIKTVVQQGAEIVDAMLGFSRGSDSPAAPCDLNAVIADTVKLLGDRFLREAEVRIERGENLPEISAPKDFIQQILLNFIFNAAEAQADHKQILISTRITPELPAEIFLKPAPAASFVLISVRDCGCGIAPEIKPRIFEPFFTTKALSTKRGTGLGLSMAYELAKKMEAGLAVESIPGQGSTFTLILPAGAAAAPPVQKTQTAVPAKNP